MTSGRQLALAISLFTAAVAALFATRWGMWFDEVMTVVDTARPLGEMLQQRAKWGHAPLYFTLIWGWQRLAGDSDFMLRLPAAAFAGLSVYAVFRLVRDNFSKAVDEDFALECMQHIAFTIPASDEGLQVV